jgi:hypothetical protein
MTTPAEERRTVIQARLFLSRLVDRAATPGVPHYIRDEAKALLKHYPWDPERWERKDD